MSPTFVSNIDWRAAQDKELPKSFCRWLVCLPNERMVCMHFRVFVTSVAAAWLLSVPLTAYCQQQTTKDELKALRTDLDALVKSQKETQDQLKEIKELLEAQRSPT